METVLITGGSGLLGNRLTEMLVADGYAVRHLGRSKRNTPNVDTFTWNWPAGEIEAGALDGVDHIVHLAGMNLADKRWNPERKKLMEDSRVETGKLLYRKWQETGQPLKSYITSSGISAYGTVTRDVVFEEGDPIADDFLGELAKNWEGVADLFADKGIRTVAIRTGVVLAADGGALEKMAAPVKMFVGAALGSGKQWVPWIHLDDICGMYHEAIRNENWQGVYNGVAPEHITNKGLTKAIGKALNRPVFLPNVPGFVLKMMVGDMAGVVLEGTRVSSKKVLATGFSFRYRTVEEALSAIY